MLVRHAYKLDQDAEQAIKQQKQAAGRHQRPWFCRIDPEDGEQQESFQESLIELRRVQRLAVDHDRPGRARVGRPAPQFAVDKIADPAKAEPERHQRCGEIADLPETKAAFPGKQHQRDDYAEQTAVERHAAFPDLEYRQRIFQDLRAAVEQHVTEAAAENDPHGAIENQVIDLYRRPAGVRPPGPPPRQPPGSRERQQIHQAVPANFEWTQGQGDGIEERISPHRGQV
ncbi:hypothetical protein MnTg04_00762 [bacterium MnTg04]|nr:hypothetical protein MnTg04_00762 [bacterium MnTg04]